MGAIYGSVYPPDGINEPHLGLINPVFALVGNRSCYLVLRPLDSKLGHWLKNRMNVDGFKA